MKKKGCVVLLPKALELQEAAITAQGAALNLLLLLQEVTELHTCCRSWWFSGATPTQPLLLLQKLACTSLQSLFFPKQNSLCLPSIF